MERKTSIDAFGASSLILFSALLGLNQVLIRIVNSGMQPVFQAGLRSLCVFPLILILIGLGLIVLKFAYKYRSQKDTDREKHSPTSELTQNLLQENSQETNLEAVKKNTNGLISEE